MNIIQYQALTLPADFYELLKMHAKDYQTQKARFITLNFADPDYNAERGGFHPVEIGLSRQGDAWHSATLPTSLSMAGSCRNWSGRLTCIFRLRRFTAPSTELGLCGKLRGWCNCCSRTSSAMSPSTLMSSKCRPTEVVLKKVLWAPANPGPIGVGKRPVPIFIK